MTGYLMDSFLVVTDNKGELVGKYNLDEFNFILDCGDSGSNITEMLLMLAKRLRS